MRKLLKYLRPYWKGAVLAPLFMLLEVWSGTIGGYDHKAALIPSIDIYKTLGLVQLPGVMTGMILAGASPVENEINFTYGIRAGIIQLQESLVLNIFIPVPE